ncbi:ABC transporter ATP-binding protein [Aeromicrobium endophyticum]|uniref:ABC transporter ATP-binding protein n=1 Tax=Aeromicrobium endophyticum TaxID=2292704 RepID=UPI0013147CBF|nr:ATP-binding cassette domain-containing protein [Aeromicrobium endophyticum]
MLEVRSLSVERGREEILHDISFVAGAGALGLLGVNGAGKSTLLRSLAGLLPPRSGSVLIDGADVYEGRRRAAASRQVALVPQDFDFPGTFTVREFLCHMAWMRAVPRRSSAARVDAALEAVDLQRQAGRRLNTLSGGMARRAAIAQALLADPAVLLLDESTTGLDPVQRAEIRLLLRSLAASRCVVLASHIVEDIEQLATRVAVLHHGRLLFDGATADVAGPSGDPARAGGLEAGFISLIGGDTA